MRAKLARRSRRASLSPRALTIAHIQANFIARHGVTPTDAEIAALLACSLKKVRRHLAISENRP